MKTALCMVAMMVMGSAMAQTPDMMAPPKELGELSFMVGEWTSTGTGMDMAGGSVEVKGEAVCLMKLGERWISWMTHDSMGEEMSMWGEFSLTYNPGTQKWVGSWKDSLTPDLLTLSGTWKENKLTMTSTEVEQPGVGKMKFEIAYTKVSDDQVKFSLVGIMGGQRMPMLNMTYDRKKE